MLFLAFTNNCKNKLHILDRRLTDDFAVMTQVGSGETSQGKEWTSPAELSFLLTQI